MKKVLFLSFAFIAILACKSESDQTISTVAVTEFGAFLSSDNVQLVDVRTPEEYAEGHIENSELINVEDDDFREKIQGLDKDQPVYLYCRSGKRSLRAAEIMKELGFKQIVDLEGGYNAWSE